MTRGLVWMLAATLAAAVLAPTWSRADGRSSRHVRRGGTPRAGLERGMPRDSAYARGIRLDALGQHVDALREYDAAVRELAGLAVVAGPRDPRLRGWRAKVAWQRDASEDLLERNAYAAVMPQSLVAHYGLATSLHEKYLSVRAFLGVAPRALWESAHAEYHEALRLNPRHAASQLGLARLWADGGDLARARAEFSRLGRRRDDEDLALGVAAYYAAIGDGDRAFDYLVRAARRLDQRRWAALSNAFDPLREDPRWELVIGEPPDLSEED